MQTVAIVGNVFMVADHPGTEMRKVVVCGDGDGGAVAINDALLGIRIEIQNVVFPAIEERRARIISPVAKIDSRVRYKTDPSVTLVVDKDDVAALWRDNVSIRSVPRVHVEPE